MFKLLFQKNDISEKSIKLNKLSIKLTDATLKKLLDPASIEVNNSKNINGLSEEKIKDMLGTERINNEEKTNVYSSNLENTEISDGTFNSMIFSELILIKILMQKYQ